MCGAVKVKLTPGLKSELKKYYSPLKMQEIEEKGEVDFAYWDKRPMLPIEQGKNIRLMDWGNRDKTLNLPKTGWARLESLEKGWWNHLHPKVVLIPAIQGCEKKVWFDLPSKIRAVVVKKEDQQRVYMITVPATPDYQNLTKHDRMPRLHGA